jgi:transposase-like protein
MGIHLVFMDTTSFILKQDRVGRVRSTKERRAAVVAEYQRSGLAVREFARLAGIPYNTLWNWLSEHGLIAKRTRGDSRKSVRLLEVSMETPPVAPVPPSAVTISLASGVSVELQNSAQVTLLAALIKALTPAASC